MHRKPKSNCNIFENASIGQRLSIRRTAKYFFELGLNASNPLTWEDIKKIDVLCCKVEATCDFEVKEHYEEVLKRFKEKKGDKIKIIVIKEN